MRMFISIPIQSEIIPYIEKVQDMILQSSFKGIRSRLDQMHLTLAFMKSISEKQSSELIASLQTISLPAITLNWKEIGFFSRPEGVLYFIEVVKNDELIYVQQKVRDVLADVHISFDHKKGPFHITMLRKVKKRVGERVQLDSIIPPMHAHFISLVSSTLTSSGAIHTEVARFPLLGKT